MNWFLDERVYAGSEHLDAEYVSGFDRKSPTDPAEDLAILRNLGLNDTHTLIDFGAGTGTFVLAAAPLCQRVIAVDVSPAMLALLCQKAAQVGITNIEFSQNGFLSYEHQGALSDFVYSRHALHHLPDFWKAIALQRIVAILKPGGVLLLRDLVYSFEPSEADTVVQAWLATASQQPEFGWTRAELVTHLQEEYSTYNWLLEPMLERAGFKIQKVEHHVSKIYSTYVCVKVD